MKTTKSYGARVVKAVGGDDAGSIAAIVSVFSNRDDGGEVVMPGAFVNSLRAQLPYFVTGHDWDIRAELGTTSVAKELYPGDALLPDDLKELGGLYVEAAWFTGVPDVDAVRQKIAQKFERGARQEFSIGYSVKRAHRVTEEGESVDVDPFEMYWGRRKSTLYLDELELFEWSPVLVGMNRRTALLDVKQAAEAMSPVELADYSARYAAAVLDQVKAFSDRRQKEGRELSSANVDRLRSWAASLDDVANGIRELLDRTAPKGDDSEKAAQANALWTEFEFLRDAVLAAA